MNFPIQFRSDELTHEVAEMESKISKGLAQLTSMAGRRRRHWQHT